MISHDDHYFDQADRLLEMRQGQLVELNGKQREPAQFVWFTDLLG
ncbi:hypothetical protein [Vreelandella glaciei]